MKHGKKYLESAKLIEAGKLYDPEEAVKLAMQTAKSKFDETIEVSVRLGVDPRQADQQVRGAVVLPHGTGKTVRVLVFAKGDQAKEAEAAGADYVGAEELVQKIQSENWFEFDVVVATPNMMGVVGRIGRILGPKGLMPNPKTGTVTMDVAKAIHPLPGRQEVLHRRAADREPECPDERDRPREARRCQGHLPAQRGALFHDGPRHQDQRPQVLISS